MWPFLLHELYFYDPVPYNVFVELDIIQGKDYETQESSTALSMG